MNKLSAAERLRLRKRAAELLAGNNRPLASLDEMVEPNSEAEWMEVIDRRSGEIEQGTVSCRPVDQTVSGIRKKLHARRQPS